MGHILPKLSGYFEYLISIFKVLCKLFFFFEVVLFKLFPPLPAASGHPGSEVRV